MRSSGETSREQEIPRAGDLIRILGTEWLARPEMSEVGVVIGPHKGDHGYYNVLLRGVMYSIHLSDLVLERRAGQE